MLSNVNHFTLGFVDLCPLTSMLQVKAQQSQIISYLEGKSIPFELIDISVGGAVREEMRNKAGNPSAAPPQIFNEDQYCGVRA